MVVGWRRGLSLKLDVVSSWSGMEGRFLAFVYPVVQRVSSADTFLLYVARSMTWVVQASVMRRSSCPEPTVTIVRDRG